MIYSAPRNGREGTPHWTAAKRGALLLPFSPTTGCPIWPPAWPDNGMEWREVNGAGVIVSFSVVRRPVQPEWKDHAPYVVAMIQLDAGPRLLSNVLTCQSEPIRIGMRVRSTFVDTSDPELGLVIFKVEEGQADRSSC